MQISQTLRFSTWLAAPILIGALSLTSCQSTDAPLVAQDGRFAAADVNHDAKLSLDEVNSMLVTEIFEARDLNHDHKIVKSEWVVGNDAGQKKTFAVRDLNHDKVVTLPEALSYGENDGLAAKLFAAADRNGNEFLSQKEVLAYYSAHESKPR